MNEPSPDVSVVIPCRNERACIAECVASVLAQKAPPGGFEVIVADGNSDDGTRAILDRLAAADPRLRVVDNVRRITPCAMNLGIRASRGRYVAIMGAHNIYADDYLSEAVRVLEETGADNVGGSMRCRAETRLQRAIGAAHHSPFSAGGARWHDPEYEGPADTVFGGVYRREVFDKIGFFDEELVRNQDDELNFRLSRAGLRIWQSPRVRSWYTPRGSLRALFRQYSQYGYWKVLVARKHGRVASVRHLVPAAFVLLLLVLPLCGLGWPPALGLWAAMTVLYLAANVAASIATAARSGWDLLPVLPLVFPCYHLGYGYGYLRGLFDFVLMRRREAGAGFGSLTRA